MSLGQLLEELPLDQRLARYRELADEAIYRASTAHERAVRADFLAMAAGWRVLAGEIERAMTRITSLDPEDELPGEKLRH